MGRIKTRTFDEILTERGYFKIDGRGHNRRTDEAARNKFRILFKTTEFAILNNISIPESWLNNLYYGMTKNSRKSGPVLYSAAHFLKIMFAHPIFEDIKIDGKHSEICLDNEDLREKISFWFSAHYNIFYERQFTNDRIYSCKEVALTQKMFGSLDKTPKKIENLERSVKLCHVGKKGVTLYTQTTILHKNLPIERKLYHDREVLNAIEIFLNTGELVSRKHGKYIKGYSQDGTEYAKTNPNFIEPWQDRNTDDIENLVKILQENPHILSVEVDVDDASRGQENE